MLNDRQGIWNRPSPPPPADKEGLKINNNNTVCENMDWQKGEKNKKRNLGLHEKYIYMQASFHIVLEIKM